jgi:surfactin synthase thioesterase subunit
MVAIMASGKRLAVIGLLMITFRCSSTPAPAHSADRPFHQMPDAATIPDTARFLMYDPTLPADDANRKARNVTVSTLRNQVLEIRQTAEETDTTPKLRVYDKTGKLRCTIFANGSIGIE